MSALLIIAAVLFVLAMLQIGAKLTYDANDFDLKLRVGVFRFSLPEGKDEPKKDKPPKPQKPKEKKKDPVKSARIKAWVKTAWIYREELFALIGKVLRSPTLDVLKLHMIVGASDPEVCAMNYGKINAAIGAALPVVENVFGIRKREIRVDCDFMKDENEIHAQAEITVRVYQLIAIAVVGLKLLIKLFNTQKSEFKAVLLHESSSS